ncbi:protein CREG1 [Narcine bancroftii]|uniref:protein CREG1 n=1 Tax=Narcine bancroftii TaxID=1343680 RepID=UPI0038314F5B
MASGALCRLLPLLAFVSCAGSIPPHEEVARVARFVVNRCDWAMIATISTHPPVVGRPFANVLSVSDGPRSRGSGIPYLYLTPLDISVQDVKINPEISLAMTLAETDFCRRNGFDAQSPLCCRVILCGTIMMVNKTEVDIAKKALFERHPEMASWPRDHGWYFAKLNITDIWVLDYFGGLKTVTPEEYYKVKPEYAKNVTDEWKS